MATHCKRGEKGCPAAYCDTERKINRKDRDIIQSEMERVMSHFIGKYKVAKIPGNQYGQTIREVKIAERTEMIGKVKEKAEINPGVVVDVGENPIWVDE